jgi:hypothetical protein
MQGVGVLSHEAPPGTTASAWNRSPRACPSGQPVAWCVASQSQGHSDSARFCVLLERP